LCCFDHDFDFAVDYMQGRDFGEPLTELLRKEWPLFYKLREAGLRDEITDGCLFMLPNALDAQWCLGLIVDAGLEITRIEQFREGRVAQAVARVQFLTDDLMKETHQGVWAIPGWLQVVGGDDLTTRRLKSVQSAVEKFAKGLELLSG